MPDKHLTMELLEDMLSVAAGIISDTESPGLPLPYTITGNDIEIPQLPSPKPLVSYLSELGLPLDVAESMSTSYLSAAEKLKCFAERALHTTYTKLASLPTRCVDTMPLGHLQRQIFEGQRHTYEATLTKWKHDVAALARSRLSHTLCNTSASGAGKHAKPLPGNYKRRFRYVSLLM